MDTEFIFPIRVYYEDTDAAGVVYYANYLKFMERTRTEWLRQLGFEQTQLRQQYQIIFVVKHVNIDYRKPAKFNDILQVTAQIIKFGKASLTFLQKIKRENNELCVATVKLGCIHCDHFRPHPLPLVILEALQTYD